MTKDNLPLPRSLLDLGARAVWVYANLLAKADEEGNVKIKANSWCNVIGLTRQQLRKTFTELIEYNYIANSTHNYTTNKATNLTICSKAKSKQPTPTRRSIVQPIALPTVTAKISADNLSFVDPAFVDAFTIWLDYKKKQFKFEYKTERSLKAAYTELVRLSGNNPDIAMQIVEQSMSNGWKGLFELKNNGTISYSRDTAATRKERRDRGLSLANEIVSRSENLFSLYNGCGTDSYAGKD